MTMQTKRKPRRTAIAGMGGVALAWCPIVVSAQNFDTPQTRLRPIGAPSAVDQYRNANQYQNAGSGATTGNVLAPAGYRSVASTGGFDTYPSSQIRQTAMQFGMPSDAAPVPPPTLPSQTLTPQAAPPQFAAPPAQMSQPRIQAAPSPRTLPQSPIVAAPPARTQTIIPSPSDLTPIAPPQISSGGFATVSNCANVTGPSTYSAASGIGCGQTGYVAPTAYAPTAYAPTLVAPPNPATLVPTTPPPGVIAAPTLPPAPANAAPIGPLLTFGQASNPVQVGPGLFGQPKAYVPGQGLRNWLRYFTP